MKSSLFTRSAAYGALAILGCVSFSCKDSGNAAYDASFNPVATSNGVPAGVLDKGADNALTGLGLGQDTLRDATTAVKLGESDTLTPDFNASQFAAKAAPDGGLDHGSKGGGGVGAGLGLGDSSGNPSGSGPGPGNIGGGNRSSGGGSGSSSGGAGSFGGSLASLGDTRTQAMVDSSKLGPRGDGTMNAADVLGQNGSDGAYAAGSGAGKSSSGSGSNPFAALFGEGNGGGGMGGGAGTSTVEFGRDPASIAGQADAARNGMGPMGSQDPANYFTLLNTSDNLFKIVERRYVSKSKQWAISDAQEIRRSVSR